MSKYNLIIHQEPGALFIVVHSATNGGEVWRGRCVPEEKDKTLAEAMSEVANGETLLNKLRDVLNIPVGDTLELRPDDVNHKERNTRISVERAKLIEKILKDSKKDFRVVDLTEGE